MQPVTCLLRELFPAPGSLPPQKLIIHAISLNVIYDSQANDGTGLTAKEKNSFQKMLSETEGEYGQIGIAFKAKYASGHLTYDEHDDLNGVTSSQKDGINVFVTSVLGISLTGAYGGPGASTIQNGKAFTFIGIQDAAHWTLSHEFAHQFLGDTRGQSGVLKNIFRDTYINRFVLPHIQAHAAELRKGAIYFSGP